MATGFDKDKDGRISQDELKEAVRATGGLFSSWKSKRGVKSADLNGDGFIDQNEITRLVEFAQKYLGMRIVFMCFSFKRNKVACIPIS